MKSHNTRYYRKVLESHGTQRLPKIITRYRIQNRRTQFKLHSSNRKNMLAHECRPAVHPRPLIPPRAKHVNNWKTAVITCWHPYSQTTYRKYCHKTPRGPWCKFSNSRDVGVASVAAVRTTLRDAQLHRWSPISSFRAFSPAEGRRDVAIITGGRVGCHTFGPINKRCTTRMGGD